MAQFKPTLKDPISPQSEKFEKNFKKTIITTAPDVNLNEVDNMLNEKEQSLKKKIFSLAKMESLVFSDPKLSAVYEEMAENGEEKYGYHYNETIQNMIFNDYVLNSPKYLQKYKMAIPKEKKRRDKSGINQLKKAGEKKMTQSGLPKLQKTEWSTKGDLNGDFKDMKKPTNPMAKPVVTEDESLTKVLFLVNETDPENQDVFAYFPEESHNNEYKTGYAHVGQHTAVHPDYAAESREATPEEYADLKAELEGIGYNLDVLNGLQENDEEFEEQYEPQDDDCFIQSNGFKNSVSCGGKFIGDFVEDQDAFNAVKQWKIKNNWFPNTWFVSDHGNVSLVDDNGNIISETTSAGSAGGAAGYVGYAGPAAWSKKGDLSGDFKGKKKSTDPKAKPISRLISITETNYLTDPSGFEKYVQKLNEEADTEFIPKHSQAYGTVDNMSPENQSIIRNDIENGKLNNNSNIKRSVALQEEESNFEKAKAEAFRISKEEGVAQHVNQISDNRFEVSNWYDADSTVISFENGRQLNEAKLQEKAKSKSQQRFMGMVRAVQKGELSSDKVGDKVEKAAKEMKPKDVKDFAKTKHKKLPEKINEGKENLIDFDIPEWALSALINADESGLEQEDIDKLNAFVDRVVKQYGNANFMLGDIDGEDNLGFKPSNDIDNLGNNVYRLYIDPTKEQNMENNTILQEHHLESREDKINFIKKGFYKLIQDVTPNQGRDAAQDEFLNSLSDEDIDRIYLDYENRLSEIGIDPMSIEEDMQNMMTENLDAKYSPDETYKFAVKSKYIIGFQGREDILYFKSEDEALNYVNQKPKTREYLGANIKEDMQTMIQNNGTSMSNKAQATGDQSSGVPVGMQASGGMNEESEFEFTVTYMKDGNRVVADEYNNIKAAQKMKNMIDPKFQPKVEKKNNEKKLNPSSFANIRVNELDMEKSNKILNPAQDAADAEHVSPMDRMYNSDAWVQAQRDVDGIDESFNVFEQINKELEAFSIHHNKLKLMAEDRKPSALVLRDRVGSENEKNFKKDLQNSGTKEIIDVEKELMWKDQQTDVPNDPQKLGQDIEKQAIKTADMKGKEALKNVGDSTNDKGDEIPKRNLTPAEQEEVNLYRQGLHSSVFDNKPSKRFEDRMKADMGDEIYDQRQKQIGFKGQAPMYNKDPQPVEDTTSDKVQFNKNQTGWNERVGIDNEKVLKESMITGRYIDVLGKRRLTEFRLSEVQNIEKINENLMKLSFDGLGNTYMSKTVDKKVVINEAVTNAMNSYQFYTDGKAVFSVKNPVQKLNENELKNEKPVVNEQVDKMKHLLGYKPKDFVNTSNVKKNRGF